MTLFIPHGILPKFSILSELYPVYMGQKSSGSQFGLQSGSRSRRCTWLHGTFIVQYNKVHHIVVHCLVIVTS